MTNLKPQYFTKYHPNSILLFKPASLFLHKISNFLTNLATLILYYFIINFKVWQQSYPLLFQIACWLTCHLKIEVCAPARKLTSRLYPFHFTVGLIVFVYKAYLASFSRLFDFCTNLFSCLINPREIINYYSFVSFKIFE